LVDICISEFACIYGSRLISGEANPRGKYSNGVAATIWRKIEDIESKPSIIVLQKSSIPKPIEAEKNSLVQYTPASNIPFQLEHRPAFQHASMSSGDSTYMERRELVPDLEE
jgi:hypothetical protein